MTDPTSPASQTPSSDVPAPASPTPPPAAAAWQAPPAEPGPAPGVEFGGFGERLLAYIIDAIILSIVFIVFGVVGALAFIRDPGLITSDTTIEEFEPTPLGVTLLVAVILLVIAVSVLYFPWFWARSGQTPGMRPFGLYVVRDSDGSPIGWGTALLRLVGFYVSSAVFDLGFIWILIDKRRRGWHDLIAGTVVIKRT